MVSAHYMLGTEDPAETWEREFKVYQVLRGIPSMVGSFDSRREAIDSLRQLRAADPEGSYAITDLTW